MPSTLNVKFSFNHTYLDPRLLLHGGATFNQADSKAKSQPDLFVFDVETLIWKKFFVFDQPSARDQHSLTKIGSQYFLYGGHVSPDNSVLDELWMLNLDSVAWTSKTLELPGIVWEKIETFESIGGLYGHRAVAHPN